MCTCSIDMHMKIGVECVEYILLNVTGVLAVTPKNMIGSFCPPYFFYI